MHFPDIRPTSRTHLQSFHPGAYLPTAHRSIQHQLRVWLCNFDQRVQSRWILLGGRGKSRFQIFTLGTSHWREGKTPPYYVFQGTAPFLHGAIHFLPHISLQYGVKDTDYIALLDIDTEEYRKGIRLPPFYYSLGDCQGRGIVSMRTFEHLSLLEGSLCLTFDLGRHKWLLELWLLKDYNNAEWVKGYTIDVSVYPYTSSAFQAYPVDTEGEDILLDCRDVEGVSILGYNPQDGTVAIKKDKECAATFYTETFYPLRRR